MSDTDDCCAAIILALGTEKRAKKRRKPNMWVKSWLLKRNKFGHDRLVTELRLTSAADYRNYLRMDAATFSELLEMVTPFIQKITTNMKEAISPELRLLATMRYLVSGASFEELKFQTAI
ncbi:hypothetical protein JTB14_002575 [Gonioctena quinquepunctata]|nr:hypothetical protein JTB14_002575 [Gonioctena quinquepunctata]